MSSVDFFVGPLFLKSLGLLYVCLLVLILSQPRSHHEQACMVQLKVIRLRFFSGQVDAAYFISICNVGSFLVSSLYMSSLWSLIGYCLKIIWMYLSISVSDISCVLSVRYARDSVSAITDSRPEIYVTSNSYFCSANKNLCILGGLFVIDFLKICLNGLWSFSIIKGLP